ncbi:Ras-related proteina [Arachis hypogaea]|nr:Ras-related proteina [Arachis hypogaea]
MAMFSSGGAFSSSIKIFSRSESERAVSRKEGLALAKELGCLLLKISAKTRENVEQCFEELALKHTYRLPLIHDGRQSNHRKCEHHDCREAASSKITCMEKNHLYGSN